MKIVINKCYGGFSISKLAMQRMAELENKQLYFYKQTKYQHSGGNDEYIKISVDDSEGLFWYSFTKDFGDICTELDYNFSFDGRSLNRSDENLIKIVEELGKKANGSCADLKVVEIPDDVEWEIEEYDGLEWVSEVHRTWG